MKIKIGVLTLIMAVMVLCGCGMKKTLRTRKKHKTMCYHT